MRNLLMFGLFSLFLTVLTGVAAADDAVVVTPVGVTTGKSVKYIPPGVAFVQKWTVKQLPGQIFNTRTDAIVAGFNASLMRMDLQQVTFIEPVTPENMAAAAATAAGESTLATK